MPSLAELTDQYPQQDNSLPVEQPYRGSNLGPLSAVGVPTGVIGGDPTVVAAPPDIYPQPTVGTTDYTNRNGAGGFGTLSGQDIVDKLIGLHGQERYQLWPEKVVRDAISAPHDIIQANPYPEGSEEASWFEDQRANKGLTSAALNMSALAGTGGLAGTGAELGEAVGAGPFLRPALKVGDKIYKAPIKDAENPLGFGAEHSDALPAHLADDFYKKAMSGEDINHYNFGFVNHKGQFLDRGKALDYGIEQGLVDPQNGKYGVLTSTMLADSSKPGTAIEATAKSQPFYSALEHNVNAIQQPKMTGDQWLGTLANKPGVKPEEMDWTGVKDFLKEKGNQPVTKAELQEHLQNNKVELKEVDKGTGELKKAADDLQAAVGNDKVSVANHRDGLYADEIEQGLWSGDITPKDLPTNLQPHAEKLMSLRYQQENPTKYHSYQLPGGENYREKLLTLPKQLDQSKIDYLINKGYTKQDATSIVAKEAGEYKSSHWDEPNILAHVRMNDKIIDGKKSLHLEEIQSDWHQQGRDRGYAEGPISKATGWENTGPIGSGNPVPNAPFKKSWHELALKRMIREAAEKGYDRLSWTPGEAQAARYDLSKSVSEIHYNPNTGYSKILDKNGKDISTGPIAKDKLADTIGKEAAEKLLKAEPNNLGIHSLTGQDLKIGGEGMKGFYDQIIPKSISKISGEKVKTAELPGKLSNKMGEPPETTKVHYIDIPQSLKDKALGRGFPLFSSTHMFLPVSHNPFEDKKK